MPGRFAFHADFSDYAFWSSLRGGGNTEVRETACRFAVEADCCENGVDAESYDRHRDLQWSASGRQYAQLNVRGRQTAQYRGCPSGRIAINNHVLDGGIAS